MTTIQRPRRPRNPIILTLAISTLAAATIAACGDESPKSGGSSVSPSTSVKPVIDAGDGGEYAPQLDPANFTTTIDNPYLPLIPGTRWVYEGGNERVEVVVTNETRLVDGIEAVVVHDTAYEDGEMVEDTFDWFAQDLDGNVWYLGEDTAEYENGKIINHAGAWEHGVDGAYAGIVMPAAPEVGDVYRQEFLVGEAEDMFEVVDIAGRASVPFGDYEGLVVTHDWSPLEPDIIEQKYYARGVGLVLAEKIAGGDGREELVSWTAPSGS